MTLIGITSHGLPAEPIDALPAVAPEVGAAYLGLYQEAGFVPPWLGYFVLEDGCCIGSCGFKGPPANGRVEIAYFTFPGYEGRGHATGMARALLAIARETDPDIVVAAQTLPGPSASTSILKRLGFTMVGSINHPEDGKVWEWQRVEHILQEGHRKGDDQHDH
jgi:ribosomal-protein-alanine N-acetyltransferase